MGGTAEETRTIKANNDSIAYARGSTEYLLALHAYNKMSDNAKLFISKPVRFVLTDENGRSVDSMIGKRKAEAILTRLQTLIN